MEVHGLEGCVWLSSGQEAEWKSAGDEIALGKGSLAH